MLDMREMLDMLSTSSECACKEGKGGEGGGGRDGGGIWDGGEADGLRAVMGG